MEWTAWRMHACPCMQFGVGVHFGCLRRQRESVRRNITNLCAASPARRQINCVRNKYECVYMFTAALNRGQLSPSLRKSIDYIMELSSWRRGVAVAAYIDFWNPGGACTCTAILITRRKTTTSWVPVGTLCTVLCVLNRQCDKMYYCLRLCSSVRYQLQFSLEYDARLSAV